MPLTNEQVSTIREVLEEAVDIIRCYDMAEQDGEFANQDEEVSNWFAKIDAAFAALDASGADTATTTEPTTTQED